MDRWRHVVGVAIWRCRALKLGMRVVGLAMLRWRALELWMHITGVWTWRSRGTDDGDALQVW